MILLAGCSLPKNETALVERNRTQTLHKEGITGTVATLYPKLAVCYNKSSKIPVITTTSAFTLRTTETLSSSVLSRHNEDKTIDYAIANKAGRSYIFGMKLHLEETDDPNGKTRITSYVMNGF